MLGEHYIIANQLSNRPLVCVWLNGREEFIPLAVYGMKDHATIKIQNKIGSKVIHDGKVYKITPKNIEENGVKKQERLLI
jgi:hypothetical protein